MSPSAPPPSENSLWLLGTFALHLDSQLVAVPAAGQRLLALLAVHDRPVRRASISAVLWPESDGAHSAQNLRSVLHRLPGTVAEPLVHATRETLTLDAGVRVDLHECTRQVLEICEPPRDDAGTFDQQGLMRLLLVDLLPDWYDEWLLVEQERHRQLRMHALEAVALRLRVTGRYAGALHAALCAVAVEPLRESAHRCVVEIHLAEGNVGEALHQYDVCRRLLDDGLGIVPSQAFQALVFPRGH